jgi:hypothetical protein
MRGNAGISNPNDTAAVSLKLETSQTIRNASHPVSVRTERLQDLLLVLVIRLRATFLGLTPLLTSAC